MNKEHIEQLAKDFCKNDGMTNPKDIKYWTIHLTGFLTSLIEKGELVEADKYESIKNILIDNGQLFPETEDQVDDFEKSTFLEKSIKRVNAESKAATPAKLISETYIEEKAENYVKGFDWPDQEQRSCAKQSYIDCLENEIQVQKVISDEEINRYVTDAIKYHPYTKYQLMVNAIKWMREQLTK